MSSKSSKTYSIEAAAEPKFNTNTEIFKNMTKHLANVVISKTIHKLKRSRYDLSSSKTYVNLPVDELEKLDPFIIAAFSGPDTGIENIDVNSKTENGAQKRQHLESFKENGLEKWNKHAAGAYGLSFNLYEMKSNEEKSMEKPIADTFAVLARADSAILVLSDGVKTGSKSKIASRCAVRATINYLNGFLFFNLSRQQAKNTHEVFKTMSAAFDEAQDFIVKSNGTMATLCCSVVVKLADNPSLHAVCTLSVGDSTAYVYSKEKEKVFELTKGSRDIEYCDFKVVRGALGNAIDNKPDLSNLIYSVTYVKEGDIVFLMSDGVSDNFDPCVSCDYLETDLTAEERYNLTLSKMKEVISNNKTLSDDISAKEVCGTLISHVIEKTNHKRNLLESLSGIDTQKASNDVQDMLKEALKLMPGKLDYATVVAYEVENGNYRSSNHNFKYDKF